MEFNENPTSVNISKFAKYNLSLDETVLFDWFVNKQECFKEDGIGHVPFFYQFRRIAEETRVTRRRFEAIVGKFITMGFLRSEAKGDGRVKAKVTHYFVDYNILIELLPKILIIKDAKTREHFNYFQGWLKERALPYRDKKNEFPPNWKEIASKLHKKLENVWNERVDYMNYHDESKDNQRDHTTFPHSNKLLQGLFKLSVSQREESIEHSFIAFADECLLENNNVKYPLNNFCYLHDDRFPVFERCLNTFNLEYTHSAPESEEEIWTRIMIEDENL